MLVRNKLRDTFQRNERSARASLWGLRARKILLHDGSAINAEMTQLNLGLRTVTDAILAHDGKVQSRSRGSTR
jgi:hypothetical protein